MKSKFFLPIIILLGVAACKKDDSTTPRADKVTVNITSPQNGQSFKKGARVSIKATVTYPQELHGYEVSLIDTATNTTLWSTEKHVHGGEFTIDESWVDTLSKATDIKLNIKVAVDHSNITEKSVHIKSTP